MRVFLSHVLTLASGTAGRGECGEAHNGTFVGWERCHGDSDGQRVMTDRAQQRERLTEYLQRIQARGHALEANLNALVLARRNEYDDDEHDPEGATLSSQWSMEAGLLESARAEVRRGNEALERLDAGTYGLCLTCSEPIPDAELEARPFRERCVHCAN